MKNFIELKDSDKNDIIVNINTITTIDCNNKGEYILWSVDGKYLRISKEGYEKLKAILLEGGSE